MIQHRIFCFLAAWAAFCAMPGILSATPLLTTISETEDGHTQTWWPHSPEKNLPWIETFEKFAIQIRDPQQSQHAKRLSPMIYKPETLSNGNARNLAALFESKFAVNGEISWQCHEEKFIQCTGNAKLALLDDKTTLYEHSQTYSASAANKSLAKKQIRAHLAFDIAAAISKFDTPQPEIPKLSHNPVIAFSALPNADTLVAIRKTLKRLPSVSDIREIWTANGILALEINPGSEFSEQAFQNLTESFLNAAPQGCEFRLHSKTADMALFDAIACE